MNKLLSILLCSILISACNQNRYDVIIRNALVVDGSGAVGYQADVGINADTIAIIGDLSKAVSTHVIDASGLVLAPGFIDTHSHHDRGMFDNADMIAL
ncbi:MAG TPA: hypothetical protein DIW27_01785, partial [Cytophagales bacterium]|nr:hypothetical protein [Cytophagales bacterium]